MTNMSELPVDLIEEVLCRVPATSLKRLRSTCKLWNCLFQDNRFATKHLDKAPKQFLALMLMNNRICPMRVNLHGDEPSVELKDELSLMDPLSSSGQFEIHTVLHCEGLLLCTNQDSTRIVVWNPCTGQTRWIQPIDCHHKSKCYYALGSCKSDDYSYKILGYSHSNLRVKIYDMHSNSWRTIDAIPDSYFVINTLPLSVKGKTYWFAYEDGLYLVSFDYATERFERLHLAGDDHYYKPVREEKLCVLLNRINNSITEIWVTNKTGETAVFWTRVLALDLGITLNTLYGLSFLVDEEMKVVLYCDSYMTYGKTVFYIVGEDNKIRRVEYGFGPNRLLLISYAPSLTQIQQGVGCKSSNGE